MPDLNTLFNLWIMRSVRNKLLWALRYANVSLGCRPTPFVISRLRKKAPDIKTTTVVGRSFPSRDQEVLSVHCVQSFWCYDFVPWTLPWGDKLSSCGLWTFQISTITNFGTDIYELLKLFDLSGDKRDERSILALLPRGGTLGISGRGCAAGTLEPLTYTRASSAEFCYPILE